MRRVFEFAAIGALTVFLSMPAARPAVGDEVPKGDAVESENKDSTPAAKPLKELTPAQIAMRDRVRQLLAAHQKQPFNTGHNSATEIMAFCVAYGCGTEIALQQAGEQRINGITSLCWNYPCAGFELMTPVQGHVGARLGYGYQEHPGEFLAMLALSRVQSDYPIRVGKTARTVADVIETEKLACRTGSDLSLTLIGLSYYVEQPEWTNELGETWSLDRIIQQELAQPMPAATEGGVNRLLGLSYAVARRIKREQPIDGQFHRAQKFVADYHAFALSLQNADGSWGPSFLAARSASQEPALQLRSSGRVLEWLAMSLSDKQLEEPKVVNAVDYVTRLLGSQRYYGSMPSLSTREIAAAGHALHALAVYDERIYKPADAPQKPAEEKAATAAAADDATAAKL